MSPKKKWNYIKVGPVTLYFNPPYEGELSYSFREEIKQSVEITNIQLKEIKSPKSLNT